MPKQKEFEDLEISEWKFSFAEKAQKVYRVFKSETEFETVEAESANEAFQKAGIEDAIRVKAGVQDRLDFLDESMLAPAAS